MAQSEYVLRDALEYELVFQGPNVDSEMEERLPNISRTNIAQIPSDVSQPTQPPSVQRVCAPV